MEDHREAVVVIVAGYTAEMERFLTANPGVAFRFSRTITFSDYVPEELLRIVEQQADAYSLAPGAPEALLKYFTAIPKGPALATAAPRGRPSRRWSSGTRGGSPSSTSRARTTSRCSTPRTCRSCPEPRRLDGRSPSGRGVAVGTGARYRLRPQPRQQPFAFLGEGRVRLVVPVSEDRRGQRMLLGASRRRAGPSGARGRPGGRSRRAAERGRRWDR